MGADMDFYKIEDFSDLPTGLIITNVPKTVYTDEAVTVSGT